MKKLISLLIAMCMVISCAAAAYAAETEKKEEDYSSLFFEHMKEYVEMNEYHQGLVKSSYKLLGDTSNGYHIAYCRYHWGDNVDLDFPETKHVEIGDYLIVGDGYPNKPSGFGLYCFNSEKCYTIEEVFEKNTVSLDEAAKIINKSRAAHVYNKKDDKKDIIQGLVDYYYGPNLYPDNDHTTCEFLGEYDKYTLFIKGNKSYGENKIIDDYYIFHSTSMFVFDGKEIYSLASALYNNKFKIGDVVDIIDAKPIGDANLDGKLDMADIVWLQRLLVHYENLYNDVYHTMICDAEKSGIIDMCDIVRIQRKIAGL